MAPPKKRKASLHSFVIYFVLAVIALIIIVPLLNVVIISITTEGEYIRTPFLLFPKSPTLDSYRALFLDGRIWIGYRTTFQILLMGLPLSLLLTVLTAYAIAKPVFPGKKFIVSYILFTMFFSGGIIPLYLLVKGLNLTNSLWAVVLVGGVNTFNLIIMRNYFIGLPDAVEESARIDGAGELLILFKIVIPLSAPIIATVTLFYAVGLWNEWFNSMIFIRDTSKVPLQLVLRSIVIESQIVDAAAASGSAAAAESMKSFGQGMKMAAVFATMVPIMLAYPFLQKHFVKGVLIGAIKA